jgi:hypothetical protein
LGTIGVQFSTSTLREFPSLSSSKTGQVIERI